MIDIDLLTRPIPSPLSRDKTDFDDSVLSDLANEINVIQKITNEQLQKLIEENYKSSKTSLRFAISSMVISSATLIITTVGVYFQLF